MDFDDDSAAAFKALIHEAMPDVFVSNYIIVAEVQDANGSRLSVGMSDGVTPWLALGMLESATDMVLNHDPEDHS